jgi:hypothetical protein
MTKLVAERRTIRPNTEVIDLADVLCEVRSSAAALLLAIRARR